MTSKLHFRHPPRRCSRKPSPTVGCMRIERFVPGVAYPLRLMGAWSRSRPSWRPRSERNRAPHDARHIERDVMNLITYLRARFLRDDSGQDLLEYALLVALIALVCVAVITSTGSSVQTIFSKISSALSTAAAS